MFSQFRSAFFPLALGITLAVTGATHAQEETKSEPQPSEQSIIDRIDQAEGVEKQKEPPTPDLAYGAYQRGMYLTAFELALPRANAGDPAAQTLIAQLYDEGLGVKRDPKESTAWYGIAAKSGNREAKFAYALKLLEGKHITKDEVEAKRLLKEAADAGHAIAAFNYAQQVVKDRPSASGFREARPYFEAAAKAGIGDAFYSLSLYYRQGLGGTVPDPDKARYWLIRAARSGFDTAQIELGIQLANGSDGEKDERSAFAWFQIAAASGNPVAQNRLAKMLVLGIGTKPDVVEAAKWHILATRAGRTDLWLDDFMRSLDTQTKAQAFDAANRWPG